MMTLTRFILNFFIGSVLILCSFVGMALASALLFIFYFLHRFFWMLSGAAALERDHRKFKIQQKEILSQANKRRNNYSRAASQQNIAELTQQIEQQLQIHQQQLDPYLVEEVHYLLSRYLLELNFEKTLNIHAIVNNKDTLSINLALTKFVRDINALD